MGEAYDRETTASYSVIVKADDNNGGTDTIDVTINVNNEPEPPLPPAAPTVSATSGNRNSLDVNWIAPNNVGRPAITSYDLQYKTSDNGWTAGPQGQTGVSAEIAGLEQNTSYDVQVRATNGDGDSAWSEAGSGTTSANNAPIFSAGTTARSFTETVGDAAVPTAADIGAAVTADDDDNDTLTYSLVAGADATKFEVDSTSGQIRTKVGEQYDRETKASYTVTVTAEDVHGGTDTTTVTINVDNATEAPLAPGMPTVSATSGSRTSLDVSWSAPNNTGRPPIEGYDLRYKKTPDGGWTAGPEDQTGAGAEIAGLEQNMSYDVQVLAANVDGDSDWSSTGGGRTNANSAPAFADSSTTRSFTETVGDAAVQTAADIGAAVTADDDDNDTLTYSLGGTDAAEFTIVLGSGQIRTKVGEQYDREAKPSYSVTVTAEDVHDGTDTIDVTIDVGDAPELPLPPAAPTVSATSGERTSLDVTWAAPDNVGRPGITGYKLQYKKTDGGWTGPQDHDGLSATIIDLDQDTSYDVQVLAANVDGDGEWSDTGSGTTNANNAPAFATASAARSFTETVGDAAVQTAADIGAAVTAEDDDNDTLTYSLGGTDAAEVRHRRQQRPDPDQGQREVRPRDEGELHGHRHGRRRPWRHGHDHRHDRRRQRDRAPADAGDSHRLGNRRQQNQPRRELVRAEQRRATADRGLRPAVQEDARRRLDGRPGGPDRR